MTAKTIHEQDSVNLVLLKECRSSSEAATQSNDHNSGIPHCRQDALEKGCEWEDDFPLPRIDEQQRLLEEQQMAMEGANDDTITFYRLICDNRQFRLFLLSFILARIGGWLTYIASITLIEETLSLQGVESKSAVSVLVAVRFLPIVLLSPFGGALADGHDRRQSMIRLDILGAACPLFFLLAMKTRSIALVYVVTFLQQSVCGLYDPCRSSILPLLVTGQEELKKATTLTGLSWAVFAAFGSSLGGLIVQLVGLRSCFLVDSATYLASAGLLWVMGGDWSAAVSKKYESASLWDQVKGMTVDGVQYLRGSFWGSLVFLKASGSIVNGASDILNVSFSETAGSSGEDSAIRLGALFACFGVGAFLGSLTVNSTSNMKQPSSVQRASIFGLAFTALGCLGTGLFQPFWLKCFFTVVRSAGSSLNWINSSLLLQKFSAPEMLGRVSALDGALALLTESSSALLCGFIQDHHLVDHPSDIALIMATVGIWFTGCWSLFHAKGGGAASSALECSKDCHGVPTERTPLVPDVESQLQS